MTDYSELEDAVRRVQQDMDDVSDVWRHCRIAMVADEEIVGFPSFNKAHLRALLTALFQSKAREERMREFIESMERRLDEGLTWEKENLDALREAVLTGSNPDPFTADRYWRDRVILAQRHLDWYRSLASESLKETNQ